MKLSRFLRGCIVAATCTGMLSGQFVHAAGSETRGPAPAQAAAAQPQVQDVALHDRGVFAGSVVDSHGNPCANVPVTVSRQGELVAKTETNAGGQFAVQGLTGGLYEVQTPVGAGVYRLWAPNTAPPSAQPMALVAPENSVVRAQFGLANGGGALGWLANPWVLAAVVAAAIAIPLALDDDDAS